MRNPFRIRASQRSTSDEEFVKLFGAGALELLEPVSDPWGGVVFLRSAPGGGKTTFMRLLTPRPLQLTNRLVDNPDVKATHDALKAVGAINDTGPDLLGAMVVFNNEYRDLAQFDRGHSLFRALLNSRIVIATLRAVLDRLERSFPDDLKRIRIEWLPESDATIPGKATGNELFKWASEIERGFYDRMDDLGEPESRGGGHARLDGLQWFARCRIFSGSTELHLKRVLLLDELQTLDPSQRASLTEFVTNAREQCGVWIAERLEALTPTDLLSEGALKRRDYEGIIQLERLWSGARIRTFAKFVEQIATLRASKADGFENRDFVSLIGETDDQDWLPRFEKASEGIASAITRANGTGARYSDWLSDGHAMTGGAVERAIRWRTMQILLVRDQQRTQVSFDFDAIPTDEKKERAVERAAEHFLRSEIEAPRYFGRDALAAVSSYNVDQYLEVAGELFEEISAKISSSREPPAPLSVERQDAIISRVAQGRWEGLARRLPRGYDARRFLEGVGEYCRAQTFRPSAPYVPGVTGFAITMQDRKTLIDTPPEDVRHFLALREVLTSLVAHNLLVPQLDYENKGRSYVVFYLNRLLCVQFGLPLGYGGWRARTLKELSDWLEHGARSEAELV